jgi:hypothetical protein
MQSFTGSWGSVGGSAVYDSRDATHKTVLLTLPTAVITGGAVAGTPADGAPILARATYADGTVDDLATGTFKVSTGVRTSGATGNCMTPGAMMDIVTTDGTRTVDLPVTAAAADTYSSVNTVLDAVVQNTPFTHESPIGGPPDNNCSAGETWRFDLSAAGTYNNKMIAWVVLHDGVFGSLHLNAPASGYVIVPKEPGGNPMNAHVTQANLNQALAANSAKISIADTMAPLANWQPGETYNIGLNTGAIGLNGKAIKVIKIAQAGQFAADALNAPAKGLVLLPGRSSGTPLDLFEPGDTIQLSVETTVMDPAGNTMDSTQKKASANAN